MTVERFQIIYDFCDWLGYQGLAYETLYYGGDKDIENLIKRYLEDEEWANRGCSNCDYHDYDEFDNNDGSYDEFEVCRKGNDVTERICKDWRGL